MHLRAYTLQTVFFYPGKCWYDKTLSKCKSVLTLAIGKVLSFELPGNIHLLSLGYPNGKIFPIGNAMSKIFLHLKIAIFAISTFARVDKRALFLELFKLFHLVPLDLYCFGDPTTTVRVIQENRKGFLFFPIFQEWTKKFCFYGLLNTFGIPGKNTIINYWKIISIERQHFSHLIERLLVCF